MCGFTGWFDLSGQCRVEQETLARMTERLVHRGPDSSGYFIEGNVALGFRRLSIIDLEHGDQPMFNEDGSLVLLCNGEIYNYKELKHWLSQKGHKFRTGSDVEVLLHLYEEEGERLVNRLNGQFSFVLCDRKRNKLFLARDHCGINPLFYTVADDLFIFASEIKALLEHPSVKRKVDLTGLDQVLSLPGLVSPRTMFGGVSSLEAGHFISIAESNVQVAEYWDLDYPRIGEAPSERSESFYVEGLRERLAQSVKYRLQSDVPVGCYLSGGLDSSLIAAMARQVSPAIKRDLFSVTFSEGGMDESKYQLLMSEFLDWPRHDIVFDWAEISGRMTKMIYHCECPVKESYNTCSMALAESAKKNGVTVILTGEGADELFGGYVGYRFDPMRMDAKRPADIDSALEEELRERIWGDRTLFYERDYYGFRDTKVALYSDGLNETLDEFDCLNSPLINKSRLEARDPLHQRSYLDFKLRLSDHLLADHGDRMALSHSVEARYPFLDLELAEFARMIPPGIKLHGYTEKYILRKVAGGLVPPRIINREKFGFHAPGSSYLLQQNLEWIGDMLSYERIRRQGYFNPDTVEALKSRYSRKGFKLALPFEDDLLMVVLSFGILLDVFDMPSLN